MILSSTTSYALRILIHMSQNREALVSANTLHEILGIHRQYLRRLLTKLTHDGFIKSSRGKYGGYEFARDPALIYLYEIIDALEGFSGFEGCLLGVTDCNQSPQCKLHSVWADAQKKMLDTFRMTSLSDLRDDQTGLV
jgi:Rrf2 family nitric oxide-sensitive transcriptional repressor